MSLEIENIQSLCDLSVISTGGITGLRITDVANIENFSIAEGSDIYTISYTEATGSYNEDEQETRAGVRVSMEAKCFVPRKRLTMDRLRQKLSGRKVAVEITDYNGAVHLITEARMLVKYTTGSRRSDSNGYDITFSGAKAHRTYMPLFIDAAIGGSEGAGGGSSFGGGFSAPPPSPPGPAEACCVSINTTPINYIPPPDSNVENRNKFVTTITGERYYIDDNGYSIYLGAARVHERIDNPLGANVFTLNNIDLTQITDPKTQLFIERTQDVLQYNDVDDDAMDVFDYKIVAGDLVLSPHWPIENGDYLNVLKVA